MNMKHDDKDEVENAIYLLELKQKLQFYYETITAISNRLKNDGIIIYVHKQHNINIIHVECKK